MIVVVITFSDVRQLVMKVCRTNYPSIARGYYGYSIQTSSFELLTALLIVGTRIVIQSYHTIRRDGLSPNLSTNGLGQKGKLALLG